MGEYIYNIKVTGNGTQAEIAAELRGLADSVEQAGGVAELDGAEWGEGGEFQTEINEGTFIW